MSTNKINECSLEYTVNVTNVNVKKTFFADNVKMTIARVTIELQNNTTLTFFRIQRIQNSFGRKFHTECVKSFIMVMPQTAIKC